MLKLASSIRASHQRYLTGATEGGVYQLLLVALVEAERLPCRSIPGFSMTADE